MLLLDLGVRIGGSLQPSGRSVTIVSSRAACLVDSPVAFQVGGYPADVCADRFSSPKRSGSHVLKNRSQTPTTALFFVLLCLVAALFVPVTDAEAQAEVFSPWGRLDSVTAGPSSITVRGWAVDGDTTKPIKVRVTVDGKAVKTKLANANRADAEPIHNRGPKHGYVVRVKASAGTHEVCVDGINAGKTGVTRNIDCARVSVEKRTANNVARPFGGVDRILSDGAEAELVGWAIDPDTKKPISVDVYVDGEYVKSTKARRKRNDINRSYDMGKRHGFKLRVDLGPGTHEICAHAINDGEGLNQKLGCGTAVVRGDVSRGGPGVVVTPTGIVTPVLETHNDGWTVWTPCVRTARITKGTFIAGAQVVIDPGHGGRESGSVGYNNLYEKTLNLAIATRVEAILEARGISAVLTRTTDVRLPLRTRAEIANALRPDIFVSIHHNGGAVRPQSTPGTEIFYQSGSDESRRAGGILFEEISGALNKYDITWVGTVRNGVSARLKENGENLYGIHRYTPTIPSVITEAGYLSNRAEAELFARDDVRDTEAVAIVDGIERWLETSDAGSGYLSEFVDGGSTGTGGTDDCTDPTLQ